MRRFFLGCVIIFLVGCSTISQSDLEEHQGDYKALVDYVLKHNLESINQTSARELPESETIEALLKNLGVYRVSVSRESTNHVLIIKKVIPPDYYEGYLYIVDTSLPPESDLYKSFESINDHWAIVADD